MDFNSNKPEEKWKDKPTRSLKPFGDMKPKPAHTCMLFALHMYFDQFMFASIPDLWQSQKHLVKHNKKLFDPIEEALKTPESTIIELENNNMYDIKLLGKITVDNKLWTLIKIFERCQCQLQQWEERALLKNQLEKLRDQTHVNHSKYLLDSHVCIDGVEIGHLEYFEVVDGKLRFFYPTEKRIIHSMPTHYNVHFVLISWSIKIYIGQTERINDQANVIQMHLDTRNSTLLKLLLKV